MFLRGSWKIKGSFGPKESAVVPVRSCLLGTGMCAFGLSGDPLTQGRRSCHQHLLLGCAPSSSINWFWGLSGFAGQRSFWDTCSFYFFQVPSGCTALGIFKSLLWHLKLCSPARPPPKSQLFRKPQGDNFCQGWSCSGFVGEASGVDGF